MLGNHNKKIGERGEKKGGKKEEERRKKRGGRKEEEGERENGRLDIAKSK